MNIADVDSTYDIAVGHVEGGSKVLVAARQSGLYMSLDMANSWSKIWNEGLATTIAISPNFGSDGIIVVGVLGGIVRSEDAGASWSVCPLGGPDVLISSLSFRTSPGNSALMLAGSVDDGLYRSADWGVNWRPSNTGAYIPRISAVLAGDGALALAGTDCGLFASTNDGLTWDDEFADELDVEVTALALDHYFVFMATASDGIYARCTCPGGDWLQLPESVRFGGTNSLAVVSRADGTIGVIAISRTHVLQYRCEHHENLLAVRLLRSDPLPSATVTSSTLVSGARVLAATADDHGTIRLFTIGSDGLSSADSC